MFEICKRQTRNIIEFTNEKIKLKLLINLSFYRKSNRKRRNGASRSLINYSHHYCRKNEIKKKFFYRQIVIVTRVNYYDLAFRFV